MSDGTFAKESKHGAQAVSTLLHGSGKMKQTHKPLPADIGSLFGMARFEKKIRRQMNKHDTLLGGLSLFDECSRPRTLRREDVITAP